MIVRRLSWRRLPPQRRPKVPRNIEGGEPIATPRRAAKGPQYPDFSGFCALRGEGRPAMGAANRKRSDGQIQVQVEVQTEAEISRQTEVRRTRRADLDADRRRAGTAGATARFKFGLRFGRRLHLAGAGFSARAGAARPPGPGDPG